MYRMIKYRKNDLILMLFLEIQNINVDMSDFKQDYTRNNNQLTILQYRFMT